MNNIGRWVTTQMVMTRHNIAKGSKRLVGDNSRQIKLGGTMFPGPDPGKCHNQPDGFLDTPGDLLVPLLGGMQGTVRYAPGLPGPGGSNGPSGIVHRHGQQEQQQPGL